MNILTSIKEKLLHSLKNIENKNLRQKMYLSEFDDLLEKIGVHSTLKLKLSKDLSGRISVVTFDSVVNEIKYIIGLMWFILQIETESIISNYKVSNSIFIGEPGCGKSTLISNLINRFSSKVFQVYCNDRDWDTIVNLLSGRNFERLLDIRDYDSSKNLICEISTLQLDVIYDILVIVPSSKFILAIESGSTYDELIELRIKLQEKHIKRFNGYIACKYDENKYFGRTISVSSLLNVKLLALSSTGSNMGLFQSNTVISDLYEMMVDKDGDTISDFKEMITTNMSSMDLQLFGIYVNFIANVDKERLSKMLLNIDDAIFKKLNLPITKEQFKSFIDSGMLQKVFSENMSKYKYVINSIRKNELKNPNIIDDTRMLRIAKGSGVSKEIVVSLLRDYDKFKTMNKNSNLNISENIEKLFSSINK